MRLKQSKRTDDIIIEMLRKRQQSMFVRIKRAKTAEDLEQLNYMLDKYRKATTEIREATKLKPIKKELPKIDFANMNYDYRN